MHIKRIAAAAYSGTTNFADELDIIMDDFHITSKAGFIVTDNASNMKKAMCILLGNNEASSSVDTYFDNPSLWEDHDDDAVNVPDGCTRLPCFAHSLQLVIRDGMQHAVCRGALGKVSKLANIVHQSSLFRTAFEAAFGAGRAIPEMRPGGTASSSSCDVSWI